MPNKPDRPIMAATLDERALAVQSFPADKEALELAWAQRFADAMNGPGEKVCTVAGRAPEPGDVLLRRDGEPDIHLQITEAVDRQRIQSDAMRRSYLKAIAQACPQLKTEFVGIQIAMIDGGQMLKLPNPRSADGIAVVAAMSSLILNFAPRARALPVCPAGCAPNFQAAEVFTDQSSGVSIHVFFTRYVPVGSVAHPQWQWSGPAWSIGDVSPDYFREAIEKKIAGNFSKINNPLWLFAYSVDCSYDSEQEAAIQSYLTGARNPYDRIYILSHGRARQVFPHVDDPTTAPQKKPFGSMLASDGIPKVNDPRYRDIE